MLWRIGSKVYEGLSIRYTAIGFFTPNSDWQLAELCLISSLPPPYHDDPAQQRPEQQLPQQFIDSTTGKLCSLVVQSLHPPYSDQEQQLFITWKTVKASGNASPALRLSAWVVGDINGQSNLIIRTIACIGGVSKAVILSPLFSCLIMASSDNPTSYQNLSETWQGIANT